jgi:hypothetical protein
VGPEAIGPCQSVLQEEAYDDQEGGQGRQCKHNRVTPHIIGESHEEKANHKYENTRDKIPYGKHKSLFASTMERQSLSSYAFLKIDVQIHRSWSAYPGKIQIIVGKLKAGGKVPFGRAEYMEFVPFMLNYSQIRKIKLWLKIISI